MTVSTKREARRLRAAVINGAAYGQRLTDPPRHVIDRLVESGALLPEPSRAAPADTIPLTPELQDALSEAAQVFTALPGEGVLLTEHPEFFTTPPVAYPVEADAVASWDDIDGTGTPPCGNCDDRKCMSCCFREVHDVCLDDCPVCCISEDDKLRLSMFEAALTEVPPIREQILVEASDAVMGDRDVTYGGPEDSFSHIADLWEAHFGYHFDSSMVAQALILLKCARVAQNPTHRDSWTDICGYSACGAEVSGAVA